MKKDSLATIFYLDAQEELEELFQSKTPFEKTEEIKDLVVKAFEAGFDKRNKELEDQAEVSAHITSLGYCCACEADVAFMEGRIEDSKQH